MHTIFHEKNPTCEAFAQRVRELEQESHKHRKTEEEFKKSQKQLYQAQKMKSLGTLVAGVALEINNPINSINLNALLLQKNPAGPDAGETEQGYSPVGEIRRIAEHALYLNNKLLSIIRDNDVARTNEITENNKKIEESQTHNTRR